MAKRITPAKGQRLTVEDFKLNERQRAFHDAYTSPESETHLNALQSALAAGYGDVVAKSDSAKWLPPTGCTPEACRNLKPLAQAIFWTLHNRAEDRRKVEERVAERSINERVISRKLIEDRLFEIVERCMGRELLDEKGRDLAAQMGDALVAEIADDKTGKLKLSPGDASVAIATKFKEYCRTFRLFRPTQAKEALRLLGVDIGMFITRLQKVPETAVDTLTPAQLQAERDRLEREWKAINETIAKKKSSSNGKSHKGALN